MGLPAHFCLTDDFPPLNITISNWFILIIPAMKLPALNKSGLKLNADPVSISQEPDWTYLSFKICLFVLFNKKL